MAEDLPAIVTLDVGGCKLRVLRATLQDCGPLYAQTGEHWKDHIQPDGSHFVDADPEIFAHVLNFLCRPTAYPIFWDKVKGFDYDLYNKLEKEAEAWLVIDLAKWIKDKKYEKAVQVVSHRPIIEDFYNYDAENVMDGSSGIKQHVVTKTRQVYVCPRGIPAHRVGKYAPRKCGYQCRKAQGDDGDDFEEEVYHEVITLRKSVRFKSDV
ncbi:hypothetical protein BDV96DRAFT_640978 [Lophiotrema nucula]|uniref:Potassium channel tetramerisation-type BTB domain-containing protein n=1 Tax=Lophiotrema nucula TaxID=690887 RepID=A0A6A5ZRJ1_9PLEO|nr:hypothetical protein BDV96DRAFT_640978 [Lophiotrema nucula]